MVLYFVYDVTSLSKIFNKLINGTNIKINIEEKNEYLYLNED